MNPNEKIIKELEQIIAKNIDAVDIPYVKGNTIRIRNIIIRPKKDGEWLLVDCKENKTITTTFTKIGAVAFAKAYLKSIDTKFVERLDKTIEKNYFDSYFYSHSLQTADDAKKDILECRLELSQEAMDIAKKVLDKFIMES